MHRLAASCLVFVLLTADPRAAWACRCAMKRPPQEAFAAATAVFCGRCVSVEQVNYVKRYTFKVDRIWKGDLGRRVVVHTSLDGAACGSTFPTDGYTTFLVYCGGPAEQLHTNICTRNALLSAADEDVRALGQGVVPLGSDYEDWLWIGGSLAAMVVLCGGGVWWVLRGRRTVEAAP